MSIGSTREECATAALKVDDRKLILRTRSGDKQAFDELVKLYQNKIFALCLRLSRNYEDAKDLTQDAFVNAYYAIKGFRLRSSFYTWLYRIAINLCYHRLKSRQYKINLKTTPLEEDLPLPSPENPRSNLITREKTELIHQAMLGVKQTFYQVLVLHDIEGLSYNEIAQIQNCSLGTVMSRLHRGRLQLAKNLKKSGIKPA